MANFYIILGVDRCADQDKIKSAYRRSAKRFHPDTSVCSESAEKFKQLTEAYHTLSDTEKRRCYDEKLRREEMSFRRAPVEDLIPRGRPGRNPDGRPFGFSPEDLVTDVRQGSYRTHWHGRPERDLYVELKLSPRQAREGGLVPVVLPVTQPCPACAASGLWQRLLCLRCAGTGRVHSELKFSISIPPRTANGTTVSLSMEDIGLKDVGLHVAVRVSPIGL
jgi:molecular chaperone DnaJ